MVVSLHVANTDQASAIAESKESTYSFLYFDTHGIVESTRNLLALSGASWKQIYPEDLNKVDKEKTPFEVLPLLYIHSATDPDAAPLVLAESQSIEYFLASKHGFLGNTWEQATVLSFLSSIQALFLRFMNRVAGLQTTNEEVKREQYVDFVTNALPDWIRLHEQHLANNGSNGHYVGEKLTLADIRTAAVIDFFYRFPKINEIINAEATPGLWKVKQTIDQNPVIIEWRASELHQSFRNTRKDPSKIKREQ